MFRDLLQLTESALTVAGQKSPALSRIGTISLVARRPKIQYLFKSPNVVRNSPVIVKVWHGVAGLYFWEFITTLGYEWNVIRGRLPYRWTIWVYSLMRMATLAIVVIPIIDFDLKLTHSCEALIISNCVLNFVAFTTADILIVLRIIAIWNRQKVVMVLAIGICVTNFMFFIQTLVRLRPDLEPAESACLSFNVRSSKTGFIATLVTDLALLLIMFAGLVRLRLQGGGTLSLGRLLWKQGIIWLLLATVAEVLPAVCASLKSNGTLAILFTVPSVVALSIGSARMHHSLIDLVYGSTETAPDSLHGHSFMVSKVIKTPETRISLGQTKGAVQRAYLEFSTLETSDDGSATGTNKQVHHEPIQLISDKDPERGAEN